MRLARSLNGSPFFAISEATQPGDLLILTSHGRGGVRRWLLGSVAEKLVREADAPVLLVPALERGQGDEGGTRVTAVRPRHQEQEARDDDRANRRQRHHGGSSPGARPVRVPPIARLRSGRLRSGWAAAGVRRRRRHRLRRIRPDGAVASRRSHAGHDDAGLVAAVRPPADRAWRRRHRAGRRPLGQDLDQGHRLRRRRFAPIWRASCRNSSVTSISKGTDGATIRRHCCSTMPTGCSHCTTSRSCAISAAISRSMRCWPRRRTARGWRRPGSTSWSSTTDWCRPTTSSTSSATERLHLADGWLRPVGEYRRRCRADPEGRRRAAPLPSSAPCSRPPPARRWARAKAIRSGSIRS